MVEWGDLLNGYFAPAGTMHSGAYNPIGAFAYDIENLVLGACNYGPRGGQ